MPTEPPRRFRNYKNVLLMNTKLTLLAVALFAFATSAFAWNTPTIASPSTGSNGWVGQTFDWNAVASSVAYQIQIDTLPGFNSPVVQRVTKAYINSSSGNTDTQHSFGNLYFGKTYYWRVRAYIANDTSAWSTAYTFLTRDYVLMASPATASTTWTGVTLDWSAHTGVSYYDMQADTSPTFASPALRTSTDAYINSNSGNTDTDEFLTNLYFGKTYYWRVRTRNSVDTSAWSSPWTFITVDYVNLASPANAASTWTGVTLDWSAHTGVGFYQMQCDTSSLFNSPAFRTSTDAYINSNSGNTDTDEYLNNLYFDKTYYWRVRAYNTVDTCAWSTVRTFHTYNTVNLSSPANNASTWTGVTLDWSAHTGVLFYDMQCDTSLSFASPAVRSSTDAYINSNSGNTDTDQFLTGLYFGTTYYWRVRARNAVDTSDWSTVWIFNTYNTVNPASPATGSQQWTGLTLDWSSHAGVQYYDLQCDTSLSFASPAFRTTTDTYINSNSGNTDTEEYLNNLYFGTTYYWRVRARNGVDTSAWSTVWTFNTVDYVNLASPANGALNQNPAGITLDWSAHAGVATYQVQWDSINLYNSPVFMQANKTYINSNSGNSDTQNGSGALATNRVYFWRVRAWNAVDTSAWTERWFSTGTAVPTIPGTPVLVSPANMAVSQPVNLTLTWNSSANAQTYEYQYALNPSFTNASSATTAATSANLTLPQSTLYYWRVRAVNGNVVSPWSTAWRFTTAGPMAAPLHISPADLSANISTSGITLDWDFVANANQYEYEYSTDNTFTSGVVSGITGATSVTTGALILQTTYYWRVRATDGVTYSPWSVAWSFTTEMQLAAPALISPANLSTGVLMTGVQLDWTSVPNATDYEYEYDTNAGFTSPVAGSTTSLSAMTGALSNYTTYYWRVRAVNGNVVSPWSPVWSFETELQLAAPSLISPADLSTGISATGVTLDWSPDANAVSYDYEYSTTANFSANVTAGNVTSSLAVTATLNALTTYYWRVRSVNGAVVSPWSVVWEFTTDNPMSVDAAATDMISVYPNPANEVLNVNGVHAGDVITLTDATGRVVKNVAVTSTRMTIDVAELPSGYYTLTVTGETNFAQRVLMAK